MRKLILALCAALSIVTVNLNGQNTDKKPGNAIRIMSYNIRNGTGMDGEMNLDRIAGVINGIKPDLAAIQEIDSMAARTGKQDVLVELAKKTGLYPVFSGAINFQGGKYGIGMLSKEKPVSSRTMPLPGKEEARTFLLVEFKDYYMCCTHLSLTEADQETSVGLIAEKLKELDTKKPVFLAGDLNAEPDSRTIKLFNEHFYMLSDPSLYTFPSDKPDKCIDYIYQFRNKRKVKVLGYEVVSGCTASDHLPIYNDVKIR